LWLVVEVALDFNVVEEVAQVVLEREPDFLLLLVLITPLQ
jgi:hypothetical protein